MLVSSWLSTFWKYNLGFCWLTARSPSKLAGVKGFFYNKSVNHWNHASVHPDIHQRRMPFLHSGLWSHSTIKAWLMERCWDNCPCSRFCPMSYKCLSMQIVFVQPRIYECSCVLCHQTWPCLWTFFFGVIDQTVFKILPTKEDSLGNENWDTNGGLCFCIALRIPLEGKQE